MDGRSADKLSYIASSRRAAWIVAVLALLLLSLASCRRGDEEAHYLLGDESELALGETATLLCSEPCRGSSQCGSVDGDEVILASSTGPALDFHDLLLTNGAAVTVTGRETHQLESRNDATRSQQLDFYAVQAQNQGTAWVAGWCIGRLSVP